MIVDPKEGKPTRVGIERGADGSASASQAIRLEVDD